jgi:CheY-like chemotaxis protein
VGKVTVLIADDLKFFLEVESTFLRRGGFEVISAESGDQAVQLASAHRPSLILLDLEMPKMDGAAACATMRRDPLLASTPIIIMSATGTPENRERCMKAGCTEFVIKPQKPEELLGIVARILKVRHRESDRITVLFNITGSHGGRQVIGRAGNLSSGGLLLETPSPIAIGSVLELEFFLPKIRHAVKVKAEVVRSDPAPEGGHRAGLRFTNLSQADQEQILDFLSS